jgi:TPR repeat protein
LAAEQGHVIAQYNLGVRYASGNGVPQSWEEAVKWFRMAADQGDADAQNNLGTCYARGLGLSQDYVEAARWLQLAADQGHPLARQALALARRNRPQEAGPRFNPHRPGQSDDDFIRDNYENISRMPGGPQILEEHLKGD